MPLHTHSFDALPTVRGTTELIFIVANPVAQAKAPEALNLVFARFGIDAVVVPVKTDDLYFEAFLRGALGAENVRGMLVSIPHKTRLMSLLDCSDAASTLAGAANAVRAGVDGAIEGALFDGSGFLSALTFHGIRLAGRRVLLLGAGGAGLAIASALASTDERPAELAIFDTAQERAQMLAAQLQSRNAPRLVITPTAHCDPEGFDLVINATPLGLNPSDPLPIDPQRIDREATVIDILMKNQPTPLESACIERGIAVFPGHEMLVQQVPAYLDFFGFGAVAEALHTAEHPVMNEVRRAIAGSRASC